MMDTVFLFGSQQSVAHEAKASSNGTSRLPIGRDSGQSVYGFTLLLQCVQCSFHKQLMLDRIDFKPWSNVILYRFYFKRGCSWWWKFVDLAMSSTALPTDLLSECRARNLLETSRSQANLEWPTWTSMSWLGPSDTVRLVVAPLWWSWFPTGIDNGILYIVCII